MAVVSVALFFLSLTLHELGHAWVARRNGIEIAGIDLWFFGGIAKLNRDSDSPGEEFRVSAAGPAVTLLIVVAGLRGRRSLVGGSDDFGDALVLRDHPGAGAGGARLAGAGQRRALRLQPHPRLPARRRAHRPRDRVEDHRRPQPRHALLGPPRARPSPTSSWGSASSCSSAATPGSGIWWILMGWFLGQSATGAVVSSRFSERLEGVTVADVMDTQPVWVPGDTTVLQAQDEFFLRYRWPWFPVADPISGRFLGLLHQDRVDGAVQEGRPALHVSDVVDADGDEAFRVHDDTPIEQLLGSEGLRSLGALMVIDRDDRLRGVVTLEQVRRALAAGDAGPRAYRIALMRSATVLRVVAELAVGEADDGVAGGGQGGVLGAV